MSHDDFLKHLGLEGFEEHREDIEDLEFENLSFEEQIEIQKAEIKAIREEEAKSLMEYYKPRFERSRYRNELGGLPKRSMFLQGDSGTCKSSLIQYWARYASIFRISTRTLTESYLIDNYFFNDFGNEKTDYDRLRKLLQFKYVFFDEFFNEKNWNRRNTLHVVGDTIEFLYESKMNGCDTVFVFASNHKIEKYVTEKSIVRKFYEIVN